MDFPLDPDLAAAASFLRGMDLSDLAAARESGQFLFAQPKYDARIPLTVQDAIVSTTPGQQGVSVRIYATPEPASPVPALLYVHGCACAMGGTAMADFTARMVVEWAGVTVVAVDYRLTPEHPYPAGLEDTYAVLQWLFDRGKGIGIDPDRVGVLGEGVGGGLAAALTLLDRHRDSRLSAQFLDAPIVDDRLSTPSMRQFVDAPMWQSHDLALHWSYYLRETAKPGSVEVPICAAPARATAKDLSGLPPAFVTTYQIDPTRDEGLAYARTLIEAGVPTDAHHYAGAFHLAHVIPGTAIGLRMIDDRIKAIRRMLPV
ncbi:esterase [Mycobacterium sherrisii]|uniref:Esterase n=1 Tax=Mycobacterium sherrisii TaxID=243061 RepID=A0A1E3T6S0_9MYCO|nr:alpha/beta hydrolase [Mycobacterium sherrisii]ODR10124.1 esterase [Mycobacterium sherrisii]